MASAPSAASASSAVSAAFAPSLTERYRARRRQLVQAAQDARDAQETPGAGSNIILVQSAGTSPDPFLWDKNLAYLTGRNDRQACLLLAPDGVRVERAETRTGPELGRGRVVHEILFVAERTPQEQFMDGPSPSLEEMREATGVDRAYLLSQLETVLQAALMASETLWLNTPYTPQLGSPLTPDLTLAQRIREHFYWVRLRNIAPLIHQQRFVKDENEVACLRRAFEIQTAIFERIMRELTPGTNEALGQAIFEYEVRARGPEVGHGMGTDLYAASIIVGAGKNAAIPHYMSNDQPIHDGDLVLIDGSAAVGGYAADITRTFPANGRFTPRQRELYALVLEAQEAAIATMKPGATLRDGHQAVYDVFKRYGVERYGYGNAGHSVGLNVHDPNGWMPGGREVPFEPGVVLVIEPFLTMPEEGLGIRIEDGVLITEHGHEVLAGPPRTIEAIEALCQRD
jgi:Xaa-Pro aminopeptidase